MINCFNVEYVHIKHNVLHNIEKVFGKYILYSYMFDTEDSKTAMSRHPPMSVSHIGSIAPATG